MNIAYTLLRGVPPQCRVIEKRYYDGNYICLCVCVCVQIGVVLFLFMKSRLAVRAFCALLAALLHVFIHI